MPDPTALPQSTWNWIGGIVATLLTGLVGWNWKDISKKVSDQGKEISALQVQAATFACAEDVTKLAADVARDFVSREDFAAMEVKVAGLVSRRELIAYMRAHREDQAQRDKQQDRQHAENKDVMREIKDASLLRDTHAQAFREEMRLAIGALALKVQEVTTIQKAQGAPGS